MTKKLLSILFLMFYIAGSYASDLLHTIERGDTLESIAKQYGVSVQALLDANPSLKDMFFAGIVLTIPESNIASKEITEDNLSDSPVNSKNSFHESGHQSSERTDFYNYPSQDLYQYSAHDDDEIKTLFTMGSGLSDNINLYLSLQGCFGHSNFMWDSGTVNGTMAYGANLCAQLYFENKTAFIPRNWYMELPIGFHKLGAASFDLNYLHLGIIPFGYRIPMGGINATLKCGVDFALPLNELETYNHYWDGDFQYGVVGGIDIEWRQFSIGCNVLYDFSEVASSCRETLNNIGILGTITYKFGKFGHK